MSLDTSLKNLLEESERAVDFRDKHLESYPERRNAFHGPYYDGKTEDYNPEAHEFEAVSLGVPSLVFDNPRVQVGTRRPGAQQDVAEAIRHGLNRWVKDTAAIKVLDAVAYDFLMGWGVTTTAQEPIRGMLPTETMEIKEGRKQKGRKVTPHWPRTYRISPRRFFMDPLALHWTEARYMGHDWIMDKATLLKMAEDNPKQGWNVESIKALSIGSGMDKVRPQDDIRKEDVPERNEVVCRTIWVPEAENEQTGKGFRGKLYTLGVDQAKHDGKDHSDFIREPRDYYGPEEGPYTIFGAYTVPDSPYPLSPLVAVQGQVEDLNDHVRQMNRNADAYKRLVLVDATMPDEMQKIAESKDRFVVPVVGIDKSKATQLELGGITQQHLVHAADKRDRLDRVSGIHDSARGVVTGRGTATEVAAASEASDTRMGYMQRRYQDAVSQMLAKVAWYMYHDDRVIFPMGMEAQQSMGIEDPIFFGGSHDEDSGATFDDLELEIEAHSMERSNEGLMLRKTMEGFGLFLQAAPVIAQLPELADWKGLFNDVGNALNMPRFGDRLNMEEAKRLGALNEQQMAEDSQPRLSKDKGSRGNVIQMPKPAESRELLGNISGAGGGF